MIHVIARIEVKPGQRARLLEEFGRIVDQVRAEAGCIEYGPTVDVETGLDPVGPPDPDTVTVIEKWESVEALRAHLDAPHMAAYRERVAEIVTGTRLHVTEPA